VKILTVLGTRPEIIRLSRTIELLDRHCEHVVVHTGQNYDPALSDLFFRELGVRPPNRHLGIRGASFGSVVGQIITGTEQVLREERPDRVLILGDTDSGLSAIVAKRLGIPVYHLEAGNRCFDDRVPEEVNRRIIDHSSDVLLPYTERSRANLLREGIAAQRVYVIGNPIFEVLRHYEPQIQRSTVLSTLGLESGRYVLVTIHRQENADRIERLRSLVEALGAIAREYDLPVICSTHPRTRNKLKSFGLIVGDERIRLLEPFGLFDFVSLERQAFCVLSDSGTVQEECCIMGVPTVTLRDVTERPETVECGSNILSGVEPDAVLRAVRIAVGRRGGWTPPPEYVAERVSQAVANIALGYR
jgi:UDP-N-acetylglucosamine 2-epimerase (non-hydrolysing)